MTEKILYKEMLIIDASVTRFQIQQAMENCRDPDPHVPIYDNNYSLTDPWPVDGNVIVEITKQTEDQAVTVAAIKVPRARTNRPNAPDVVSHAKTVAAAIRKRWKPASEQVRTPRPDSRYRATLVKWKIDSTRMKVTEATRAIGLKHTTYKNIENRNEFLDDEQMDAYLNGRTYEQAWQDEVIWGNMQ